MKMYEDFLVCRTALLEDSKTAMFEKEKIKEYDLVTLR